MESCINALGLTGVGDSLDNATRATFTSVSCSRAACTFVPGRCSAVGHGLTHGELPLKLSTAAGPTRGSRRGRSQPSAGQSIRRYGTLSASGPALDDNGAAVSSEETAGVVLISEGLATGHVTAGESVRMAALRAKKGVTAVISLEAEDGMRSRGVAWAEEASEIEAAGLLPLWLPAGENSFAEQVAVLPQAVRAVALLADRGHTVLLSAPPGSQLPSLVALGYLCFMKGVSRKEALASIRSSIPGADPTLQVLDMVREKVLAGESRRLIELAEGIYRKRVASGRPGNSDTDWQEAQDLMVVEAFRAAVPRDTLLADSIQRASERVAAEQAPGKDPPAAAADAKRGSDGPPKGPGVPFGRLGEAATSKALRAANLRIAALSTQLEDARRAQQEAQEGREAAERAGQELAQQRDALERKGALYADALAAANERIDILTGIVRRLEAGDTEGGALLKLGTADAAMSASPSTTTEVDAAPVALPPPLEVLPAEAPVSAGGTAAGIRELRRQLDEARKGAAAAARAAEVTARQLKAEFAAAERERERERAGARRTEEELLQVKGSLKDSEVRRQQAETRRAFLEEELRRVREEASATEQKMAADLGALEGRWAEEVRRREEVEREQREAEASVVSLEARCEEERAAKAAAQERAQAARDRVVLLQTQVQDLQKRLGIASSAADNSNARLGQLQKQVEEVVQKAAQAKVREQAANEAITSLNARVAALELQKGEAERRAALLSAERDALTAANGVLEVETQSAEERLKQLRAQIVALKEQEAYERARADELDKSVHWVVEEQQQVEAQASAFCGKLLDVTRKLAGLNAELAYQEGRQDELGPGWKEALGAAGEVIGELGPEAAAVAGRRAVEIELQAAAGTMSAPDLMQLLMSRLLEESSIVALRARRVQGQREELEGSLVEMRAKIPAAERSLQDMARLRKTSVATEALLAQRAERVEGELGRTRIAFAAALAVGVALAASTISGAFSPDDAASLKIASLQSEVAAKAEAEAALSKEVRELEAEVKASATTAQTLEGALQAQQRVVTQLQELIPLVAPSVRAKEASEFCANVPQTYWSAVTKKFCDTIGPRR